MEKKLILSLMAVAMLLMFAVNAQATVADKQVRVHYNDVKLYANGQLVNMTAEQEPFIFNSFTYVPLRVAGQAVGSEVIWEEETKSVYINSSPAANIELTTQIAQKDAKIAELNQQVATLQTQVTSLQTQLNDARSNSNSSSNSSSSSDSSSNSNRNFRMGDLEADLNDDYNVFSDVRVDSFVLSGNADDMDVEIKVNLSRYNYDWAELTDSEIRDWLVDVTRFIQKEAGDNTIINGQVRTTSNERLLTFSKNGTRSLQVTYTDASYRNAGSLVAENLQGKTFYVDNLNFIATTVSYSKSNELVRVELRARDSDAATKWNDLRISVVERAMNVIGDNIADEFEYEKVNVEQVRLEFYESNGSRIIYTYTYYR